jgi:predicted GNAT family N-acyltransferase
MTTDKAFSVRLATWQRDAARLSPVRLQVFVVEQKVPPQIEIDALDPICVHVIAEDASGRVIGTGRLLPTEHAAVPVSRIGRMAVYADWRSKGVGAALLKALVDEAIRRGDRQIVLHAQIHAEAFYARHGFVREGEAYEEAGIAHINMRRTL